MLSNTAVPKYYGQFRDAVIRGDIVVNENVSMYMNIIDDRIANPNYYYDDRKVEGFIAFCEDEMTLTDGSDVTVLYIFKVWAEDLLSWYEYIERNVYDPSIGDFIPKKIRVRLIHKQFIIVGRGGAKTLYESWLQAYGLTVDTSTTNQVTTAPTMKQAEEVTTPINTALTRAKGPLFKFLTEGSLQNTTGDRAKRQKLASTKKGIQNFLTNSILEIRPMTIDKLQGLRTKYNTIDEWLSGDTREDVVGPLEQGAKKILNWWIVAVSSEGTVRNGPGDDIKMELTTILRGEYYNPHVSIWWYRLDSLEELNDPRMWIKAQPNLGYTVSYEDYLEEKERAENVPSARNDILAKRFGIPMEGFTYFFTYDETLPIEVKQSYNGMLCSMGADMSQGNDFCAFDFLFPIDNGFGVKVRSYISESTYNKLNMSMRQKYDEFLKEGTLVIFPGTILDMTMVYDDLDAFITAMEYDVLAFGYDPYNATAFVDRWCREHTSFGVEKVIQGSRTESVPLGELKNLAHDKLLWFDEELMSFSMGNAITIEDTNGNRKLLKRRYDEKIDNVSALMDAFVAYKIHKELFE